MSERHHRFSVAGRELVLFQRRGESYSHVLLKALGFALFLPHYPNLEIEPELGLRYTPDLLSRPQRPRSPHHFRLWGECGNTSAVKAHYVCAHYDAEQVAILHVGGVERLLLELEGAIPYRHRHNRLFVVSFALDIEARISPDNLVLKEGWYQFYGF
ncbi:MAG: hypothetical protein HY335_08565 [Deinococcus sp.]|nr:hypothetical protein [Deinococcus sp.]